MTDQLSLEGLADLRVERCMSRNPVTLEAGARASDAMDVMEKFDVRHVPVMEESKVVGVVSNRHLRDALPSIITMPDPAARRRMLAATPLEKILNRNSTALSPGDTVINAIASLRHLRVGSLPVVEGEELVGILTSGDLITLCERILRMAQERAELA